MSYYLVWRKWGECLAEKGEIIGTQEFALIDHSTHNIREKTTHKCFKEKTECKSFFVF
jgi:hypothetical protein